MYKLQFFLYALKFQYTFVFFFVVVCMLFFLLLLKSTNKGRFDCDKSPPIEGTQKVNIFNELYFFLGNNIIKHTAQPFGKCRITATIYDFLSMT